MTAFVHDPNRPPPNREAWNLSPCPIHGRGCYFARQLIRVLPESEYPTYPEAYVLPDTEELAVKAWVECQFVYECGHIEAMLPYNVPQGYRVPMATTTEPAHAWSIARQQFASRAREVKPLPYSPPGWRFVDPRRRHNV